MHRTRAPRRAAAVLGAAGLVLLAAAPASAHVTMSASTTAAGATAVIRLEVPHGCEGSATTDLAVRMPDAVGEVSAEDTDRWVVDRADGSLTFHTDHPVPDALRDEVVFSVRLPDEVGAELVFPVVQHCQEGEAAWTETAEDAASRDDLDMPAPVLVVTAPDGQAARAASTAVGADAPGDGLTTYGAVGLLAVGCLASGAVLLMRRRRA